MDDNLLNLRKIVIPEFIYGFGARFLAGRYARNLSARKVLVVSDPGVMAAGWVDEVVKSLQKEGIKHVVFHDVRPNPRAEQVMAGAEVYRQENCNAIVAVGGGSPMDCAKGIGIVTSNHQHVLDFEGVDEVTVPGPPLICIPTTAGSSADVSQFAIITDTSAKVKVAIISKTVVPDVALIDPMTLTTMPPYLAACTGMDALTHAIEAFVSNASSRFTDLHALQSIKLLANSLSKTVYNPQNEELLNDTMMGSLYAGVAFSNASLGAVHAMAHSLGGLLDQPHGECNALLLNGVIEYNFEAVAERFEQIGEALSLKLAGLSPAEKRKEILQKINSIKLELGITRTLGDLGVKPHHITELAQKALKDPCLATNPRQIGVKDIEVLYEKSL